MPSSIQTHIRLLTVLGLILTLLPGCSKPAGDSTDADPGTATPAAANVAVDGPTVDDFSDPDRNSLGIGRQFIDDTTSGGQTRSTHRISAGILSVKGEIVPARGQLGWASTVLLLDPQGLPRDARAYRGIALRIRIRQGSLSVSANSPEVTNFDYHATPLSVPADGEFHEVTIPFSGMKRTWSEPTPLNTGSLASISLVAFGVQRGPFDFEVDTVRFY